jgi:hypothetical protein
MVASCNPPAPRNDWRVVLTVLILLCLISQLGCSAPTATTGLIAQGQRGLSDARHAQQRIHARYCVSHQSQLHALDDAFDADVKLVAAGQIAGDDGKPIPLSADWVIAARRGYALARDTLATQFASETQAHAIQLDNLAAASEALRLANELTVLQWNVSARIKQAFLRNHDTQPRSSTDE